MPKEDVEESEMDDVEKELEEFKRFCMDSGVGWKYYDVIAFAPCYRPCVKRFCLHQV